MANMPLAAHEESTNTNVLAEAGAVEGSEIPETNALPAFDQGEPSGDEKEPSKSKISTCAELLAVEGNNICFDCGTEGTLWVNMSYCLLLCAPCATIHAEFGLHLKPLSDQSLISQDFELLAKIGNKVARDYWLATFDKQSHESVHPRATKDSRTRSIIEKYRGRWLSSNERAWLVAQHHAFSSIPALYGPTYTSFANSPEALTSQTQQMSIEGHTDGYGYSNGYSNGSKFPNGDATGYANVHTNGHTSDYANGHQDYHPNGYPNGYQDAHPSGYQEVSPNGHHNGLPNNHSSVPSTGYPLSPSNVHSNGYLNGYANGHTDKHADGHGQENVCSNGDSKWQTSGCAEDHTAANGYAEHQHVYAHTQGLQLGPSHGIPRAQANGLTCIATGSAITSVFVDIYGNMYMNGSSAVQRNGKGTDYLRNGAPDFVMNSTVAYTKRSRRHRQAH